MLLRSFRDLLRDKARQLWSLAFCEPAVVPLDGAHRELEPLGGFTVAVQLGEGQDCRQLVVSKTPPLLALALRIAFQRGTCQSISSFNRTRCAPHLHRVSASRVVVPSALAAGNLLVPSGSGISRSASHFTQVTRMSARNTRRA